MRKVVGETRQGVRDAWAHGFTIIEVMFFLAISSALLVALLGTVGYTISHQRFTDSGFSLQAFFQQQYNETVNVVNDRSAGICPVSGDGINAGAGQSKCVILGRAIDLTPNSSHIVIHSIIGIEPADTAGKTGGALLALYQPTIDTSTDSSYDIAWDATVSGVKPDNNTRILLLRSPDSGLVLHFSGQPTDNLKDVVQNSDPHQTYSLCIQSGDILNAAGLAAITLSPLASTESVNTVFDMTSEQKEALC